MSEPIQVTTADIHKTLTTEYNLDPTRTLEVTEREEGSPEATSAGDTFTLTGDGHTAEAVYHPSNTLLFFGPYDHQFYQLRPVEVGEYVAVNCEDYDDRDVRKLNARPSVRDRELNTEWYSQSQWHHVDARCVDRVGAHANVMESQSHTRVEAGLTDEAVSVVIDAVGMGGSGASIFDGGEDIVSEYRLSPEMAGELIASTEAALGDVVEQFDGELADRAADVIAEREGDSGGVREGEVNGFSLKRELEQNDFAGVQDTGVYHVTYDPVGGVDEVIAVVRIAEGLGFELASEAQTNGVTMKFVLSDDN